MERYLLRSSVGPGHSQETGPAAVRGKMAPSPSPSSESELSSAQPQGEAGKLEQEAPWDPQQPSQVNPQPLVDYKKLAIEVAMRIAPDLQETLEHTVQASLLKLQADINLHAGRLSELEQRVSNLEDEKASLSADLLSMASVISNMGDKMEDLENRSRRNNLRMVGLPESIPTSDLQKLCEVDLPKALDIPYACRVERAHRVGREDQSRLRRGEGSRPQSRQVIMRYLDYNDKMSIIRAFRKSRDPVTVKGHKVLLFEDFSADVAKRRRAYSSICSQLYNLKIRFRVVYPATLIVSAEGEPSRVFKSAEEAEPALADLLRKSPDCNRSTRHRPRSLESADIQSQRPRPPPMSQREPKHQRRFEPEDST